MMCITYDVEDTTREVTFRCVVGREKLDPCSSCSYERSLYTLGYKESQSGIEAQPLTKCHDNLVIYMMGYSHGSFDKHR